MTGTEHGQELCLLVVLDVTGDGRRPGDIAREVKHALETGHPKYLERVVYVDDIPAGTRILAPPETNGRA